MLQVVWKRLADLTCEHFSPIPARTQQTCGRRVHGASGLLSESLKESEREGPFHNIRLDVFRGITHIRDEFDAPSKLT